MVIGGGQLQIADKNGHLSPVAIEPAGAHRSLCVPQNVYQGATLSPVKTDSVHRIAGVFSSYLNPIVRFDVRFSQEKTETVFNLTFLTLEHSQTLVRCHRDEITIL